MFNTKMRCFTTVLTNYLNMKKKIKHSLFGIAVVSSLNVMAQNKPNIILIMADDLGWGDTGYNGNKVIRTPNLDQMAIEGIRFNRFYSASAVSSPTRSSCLTGRNPYRTGVFSANQGILRTQEVTISELLKEEGYLTGHFGKWHLGTLTYTENDGRRGRAGNTKEYNPPKLHGYTDAFVTESALPTFDPMKKPLKRYNSIGWDYIKEGEPFDFFGVNYWNIDGEKVTDNLDGDDSRIIMDRVIPFIGKSKSIQAPFLAVVWFHAPHTPCVAGPSYKEMYKDHSSDMQNYAGCITAMDEQIGRLRMYLKEIGQDQNTMIFFCSDNGPETGNMGVTGGFRDRKRSLYEGGVRVPGIMVWPQKIKKPITTDIPCVTSDYLPTIIDILKINKCKTPNELDGISLLPLIEGKMKQRPVPIGFLFGNQASFVDKQFKLYAKEGVFELYDIVKDPFEKVNIQSSQANVVDSLKMSLIKFISSCKNSFDGGEYGKVSDIKLKQKWIDLW